MKKTLLLLLLSTFCLSLSSQELVTNRLAPGYWNKKDKLSFITSDTKYSIAMTPVGSRVKGTYQRIKPLSINGENYRIIRTEGVIHITDEAGETVLMTSNNQNLVYGIDNESFTKNRPNRRNFAFFDANGEPVIEARLRDRLLGLASAFEIKMHQDKPLMLALCIEMLVKQAREEALWALPIIII